MNIEVYTYFENVPFHEAVVRYRFNPDEVANRKESDKLNLIRADYIDSDDEGARDIGIPTCARNFLAEPATDLDRKVYQAMIDQGILDADITEVSIILCDYFAGGVPMVEFEGTFANIEGVVSGMINPFEPKDTPKMPILIWEAAAAKARDAVRRFTELTTVSE